MPRRDLIVNYLLWYNVLSLGIWVGGTLFQMLVVVPLWSDSPPESVHAFWAGTQYYSTIHHFFGPLTQVLRVVPLLALVVVAWPNAELRTWIVICAATMVFGFIFTRAYVYPMNDVLFAKAGEGLDADAVRSLVSRWVFADRLRFAVMTGGYLSLLRAFRLPLG